MIKPSTSEANRPTTITTISPLAVDAPGRPVPLEIKVSVPTTGRDLPILLLSHGHGYSNYLSSLNGYAPLANYYAAHGFAVIQPTHLDSKTLKLGPEVPDAPLYWRSRARDMTRILDQLDAIESSAQIQGRLDRSRVVALGHSMGGHTVSLLLGARSKDEKGNVVELADKRIKAGAILAGPGRGDALSKFAADNYSFFKYTDFSTMTAPAIVVAGEKDPTAHLTTAGPSWHVDPYTLAPAPKSLMMLPVGEHSLGGVSGYDVAETTDENPLLVAIVQRLTAAYFRSQLYPGDAAWADAVASLEGNSDARTESK